MKATNPTDSTVSPDASASRRPRRSGTRGRRILLRLLDWLIIVGVVAGLYVGVVGIPDAVLARYLHGQTDQAFLLEVGRVRVNFLHGLVVDDLRLYRRHVIGPAVLEAAHVVVDLSVLDGLRGRPILAGLLVENGILRPEMLWKQAAHASTNAVLLAGPFALELAARQMEVEGAWIDAMEGRLAGAGREWTLSHGYAVLRQENHSLELKGDLHCDRDGVVSGKASGEGDPLAILPFFEAGHLAIGSQIVRDVEFQESPPRAEVEFHLPTATNKNFEVAIQFWLENSKYKGVEAEHAEGRAEIARRGDELVAGIPSLSIARQEGTGQGGFMFHITGAGSVLSFEAHSALAPAATAQLIGIFTNECQTVFRFDPPYQIDASGTVPMHDRDALVLDAKMAFGRLTVQEQTVGDCSFQLRLMGRTNRIDDVRGTWQGGNLTGRAEWLSGTGRLGCVQYRTEVAVDDADFQQISSNIAHDAQKPFAGRFSGSLSLVGQPGPDHRNTLSGDGRIAIKQARVILLPVFGGLTDFLSRTIPGVDTLFGQSDAHVDFSISEGRIRSPRVRIEGDILSLMGAGSYGLDGTLDYDMQLTFLKSNTLAAKIIRVPTYLLSKLFEFKLTGTRANPRWYPINFSKDLWQTRSNESTNGAPPGGVGPAPVINWDEKW